MPGSSRIRASPDGELRQPVELGGGRRVLHDAKDIQIDRGIWRTAHRAQQQGRALHGIEPAEVDETNTAARRSRQWRRHWPDAVSTRHQPIAAHAIATEQLPYPVGQDHDAVSAREQRADVTLICLDQPSHPEGRPHAAGQSAPRRARGDSRRHDAGEPRQRLWHAVTLHTHFVHALGSIKPSHRSVPHRMSVPRTHEAVGV